MTKSSQEWTMSFEEQVYQCIGELARHFRGLSQPQLRNMAIFSLAVIKTRECRLNIMAEQMGELGKADNVERRFQRFLSNRHIEEERCEQDYGRWVLTSYEGRVVLLVDETKLGEHLSVMMVGLAYQKRCIPLVWRCYDTYPVEGQVTLIAGLLQRIADLLPAGHAIPLVEVDRGLGTSPDLVRVIETLGWQYLFRIQNLTHVQLNDGRDCEIQSLVGPGQRIRSEGRVFKGDGFSIPATLHVIWHTAYDEPWCLITNDPALVGDEYAWRVWEEEAFRDLKSGGWKWNQSHVWRPDHAQRLVLILALAYAFTLSIGVFVLSAPVVLRKRIVRGNRSPYGIFRLGLRYLLDLWRTHRSFDFSLDFVPDLSLFHPPTIV
jgi:hypothetical protein